MIASEVTTGSALEASDLLDASAVMLPTTGIDINQHDSRMLRGAVTPFVHSPSAAASVMRIGVMTSEDAALDMLP